MKKRYIALLFAFIFSISINIQTFAKEIVTSDFVEVFEIKSNNYEELPIDTALDKAIKNSTSVKINSLTLQLNEKQEEQASESYFSFFSSNTSDRLSEFLSLMRQRATIKNNESEKKVLEEKLKYEMTDAYINILNLEREIQLLETSLKIETSNLRISKEKQILGLITEQEYNNLQLAYEKNKVNLETRKKSLNSAYATLNILIGEDDTTKKYRLLIEPKMEYLELNSDIEIYAQSRAEQSATVEQLIRNVDIAKNSVKLGGALASASEISNMSNENTLAQAEMNLNDTKVELKNRIVDTYNSIIQLEENFENNMKELESLKHELKIAQAKYEMNLITENTLESTKYNVANMENTLISQMYEHMQLIEKIKNANLI